MWQPGVSGNNVSREGSAVVKRYETGLANYYREHTLLLRLGHLPVPGVLPDSRPGELRLTYVEGISGTECIERGSVSSFLLHMGQFLRQLHKVDPALVADILPGSGPVIVHGDFAPYNCVMKESGSGLAAVLDWETAHLGHTIEDLAWFEFQFRSLYPQHAWAVSSLFEGFGSEPPWELREQVIAARLEQLKNAGAIANAELDRANGASDHFGVMCFADLREMAAFVAALSRFLNAPQGIQYRTDLAANAEVWQHFATEGRPELWLNDLALNASAAAFGHIRLSGVRSVRASASKLRLIISGDSAPAWGIEDAESKVVA